MQICLKGIRIEMNEAEVSLLQQALVDLYTKDKWKFHYIMEQVAGKAANSLKEYEITHTPAEVALEALRLASEKDGMEFLILVLGDNVWVGVDNISKKYVEFIYAFSERMVEERDFDPDFRYRSQWRDRLISCLQRRYIVLKHFNKMWQREFDIEQPATYKGLTGISAAVHYVFDQKIVHCLDELAYVSGCI